MMTDRELLELAAKAAGIVGKWHECQDGKFRFFPEDSNSPFDPLTDDGDALRLAVKLGVSIFPPDKEHSDMVSTEVDGLWFNDDKAADPEASTRRLIVRAAAEIGSAL